MTSRAISVYDSPVHGKGIIANRPIRKGDWLIEYRGKIMAWDDANAVHPHDPEQPNHTFIFDLNNGYVIDAWYGKCAAKWMNHSCVPNVVAELTDDNEVWLVAKRDIKAGEELFFDYGLTIEGLSMEEFDEEAKNYECRCGHPDCRRTMLAFPKGYVPPHKRKAKQVPAKKGRKL